MQSVLQILFVSLTCVAAPAQSTTIKLAKVQKSQAPSQPSANSKNQSQVGPSTEKPAPAKTHTKSVRDELLEMTLPDPPRSSATSDSNKTDTGSTVGATNELPVGHFFWQAPKGRLAFIPYGEAAYFQNKGVLITGTPGGFAYDVKGQKYRLGVILEYGLLKYLSVGAGVSYFLQLTDEDITTSNGFEDIPVYAKGIWPLANISLHYGIRMSFSPAARIDDGFGNRNAFSGGNVYTPYFGLSKQISGGFFGLEIAYAYKDTRLSLRDIYGNQQNYQTNTEGGHVLTIQGFYEKTMSKSVFGVAAGYYGESQKTYKTNTSITFEDGESNLIGRIYMLFKSGGNEFIPAIHAQYFLDDQLGNRLLDSKWELKVRLDMRF